MSTTTKGILLILLTTILTSTAQIFYKKGVSHFPTLFTNIPLITGMTLYAIGVIFFFLALREGEVSTLTPILSTSYIIVALTSFYYLGETMPPIKIIGIITIVAGILFLTMTRKKQEESSKFQEARKNNTMVQE